MPPVRTVTKRAGQQGRSHYETPICKILVGDEEAVFKINEGLLQSISFFAKHGRRRSAQASSSTAVCNEHSQLKKEPDTSEMFFPEDQDAPRTTDNEVKPAIDLTGADADYILKGEFYHTRAAFTIFIRSLNEASPIKPRSHEDCLALFMAYALAQFYDAEILQNQVIDALQTFYAGATISISHITYLIQHWGNDTSCHLAEYLIAQTAYEMALDWDQFMGDDEMADELFASGNRVVVGRLFQSALQYAKPSKIQDPSKDRKRWRINSES